MSESNLNVIKEAQSNKSSLRDYNIKHVEKEIIICKELLNMLTELCPKEINLIVDSVSLNLIYLHFILQFSEGALNKYNIKPIDFYDEIIILIENWLEKECTGSILYSFGVQERPALPSTPHKTINNKNSRNIVIDERESHHQPSSKRFRKHISEHDIKSMEFEEDYFGPNTHEQKYGPPKKLRHLMSLAKEPRRFYDHIGTNEEGNIYTNLLNIKLDNFTVPNKPTNNKKETQIDMI